MASIATRVWPAGKPEGPGKVTMAILVVDDSRAMRMIVMRELRKAGYETRDVEEAENGVGALERLKDGGIDLVLSDWNMPEMTGIKLLKILRRDGNDVPFGFVTSESTVEMHREALDAGADFVVTKPFSADSLSRQVELALRGHRQADGLAAAVAEREHTIESVLEDLLGRTVNVAVSPPPRLGFPGTVARYKSTTSGRAFLLIAEIGAAAATAAALSRVPPDQAATYVTECELPEALMLNVHEVANILSKIVPDPEERWTLDSVELFSELHQHPQLRSVEVNAWVRPLEVRVTGYPTGRAGFLPV
jgi:DNA-binding response OmpR family regulator